MSAASHPSSRFLTLASSPVPLIASKRKSGDAASHCPSSAPAFAWRAFADEVAATPPPLCPETTIRPGVGTAEITKWSSIFLKASPT